MNKKVIFTIAPMALVMGALTGCKGGDTPTSKTLKSITVAPSTDKYSVGYKFSDLDIGTFQANYSDGSTVPVKEGYTSDPALPYTFVDGDVEKGKDFNFTYQGKSASFHVDVYKPKTLESIEAKLKTSKEYKVDETIAKSDITVTATYSDKSTKTVSGWTCDDFKNDSYTFVAGDVGNKEFTINYSDKTTKLSVVVKEDTPAWQKYCQFDINGDNTVQVSVKNNIIRSTVVGALELPSKVDGKFVNDGTAGTEYTVTNIPHQGFVGCTALTSINIPGSVIEIGYDAFGSCSSLDTVTLNEGLERIQGSAFQDAKVTDFVIPSTVIEINGGALGHTQTKLLKSLTFADKSTPWLIQPDKGSCIDHYTPDDNLLKKFNDNITTYWEKCVVEITKPGQMVQTGRSGNVTIVEGTLKEVYSSDESILKIGGTAPNFTYTAQQIKGEVNITVVTEDLKFGFTTVSVAEEP